MPSRKKSHFFQLTLSLLAISFLFGCAIRIDPATSSLPTKDPKIPGKLTEPDLITQVFSVELRIPASAETQLAVDIFDEVSGMLYNIERYPLTRQPDGTFLGTLLLPESATLRYRYVMTAPLEVTELKADGLPVGYRVVFVQKNNMIKDIVSGWPSEPYIGETADLNGIVHDSESNQPLPDVLVNIAGYQTFTDMTGRFVLHDLPVGVHVLSAVSIDGSHMTFQQQANLVADLSTPAVIQMAPLPEIKVTFELNLLTDAVGAPVRIAANYAQGGAIFTDNEEGSLASRMPLMSRNEDGSYTIEITLHAGNVLRYKYTLGNGNINAERDDEGNLLLRMVTLPDHDVTITDQVAAWRIDDHSPTTIIVTAPESTPKEDGVSIQFFTNHAHQPIPMWSMGDNQWMFLFFGSSSLGTVTYRFTRNDQAELSVDTLSGESLHQIDFTDENPQTFSIEKWTSFDSSETISTDSIGENAGSQLIGVELMPGYQPSFLSRYRQIPAELKAYGVNWLILTPSWSVVVRDGLPYLEFDTDSSILLSELAEIVAIAKAEGYTVALYPQIIFPESPQSWWQNSEKSLLWWQQWYSEYERFVMNFSQFANVNGVNQLILGGSGVESSLPGAIKTSGSNFGTPKTAEQYWTDLLAKVRTYYTSQLLFGIPLGSDTLTSHSFYSQVDGFYLTLDDDGLQAYYYDQSTVSTYLDGTVFAFYETEDKPVFFGIASASLVSSRLNNDSTSGDLVSPFTSQYGSANVDLDSQNYFYQVYTSVLAQRDWISGISTRGFFPVLQLSDFSSSIYGKPAMNSFISLTTQNN